MTAAEERSPGRLGPYRLRERLGEGGMGVVYLATGPDERLVAVKALRRGVPGEVTARRRLAREFDTMRRVHSPFVAEVIDADVDSDPPYIVTRYVPGRTVEEVVAQDGPLTGLALLRLAAGLARALTAVHAAGVGPPRPQARQRDDRQQRARRHRLRHRPGSRLDATDHDRHVHGGRRVTWPPR